MSSEHDAEIAQIKANMKYLEELLSAEVMLIQYNSDNHMPPPNNKTLCENIIAALCQAELELKKLESSKGTEYGVAALVASAQRWNVSE
jgi:homoserine acetyltransferase